MLAAVARHDTAFAFASADLKADPELLLVEVDQDAIWVDPCTRMQLVLLA